MLSCKCFARAPRSAKEILDRVIGRSLTRDPVGIMRAPIWKHLRTRGGDDQPSARVRHVDRDRYLAGDCSDRPFSDTTIGGDVNGISKKRTVSPRSPL